jgi:hypothetical protein
MLVFQPTHRASILVPSSRAFYIGDSIIEIMDKWPHLGHIINSKKTDDTDILDRRNSLMSRLNNVLCYFRNLSSPVKLRLSQAYCSSLYGCELWNLHNGNITDICIAWRKGLRRVWSLPPNTREVLDPLSNTIPMMD